MGLVLKDATLAKVPLTVLSFAAAVNVAAQREVLNKPFKPARGGDASSLKTE